MLSLLRPFTGYIMGGMLFVIIALGIALKVERRHSHKLQERVAGLSAELQRISTAKDEQRRTSERNVREVVEGPERIREVVRTIREAPNPEGCRTPGLEALRRAV